QEGRCHPPRLRDVCLEEESRGQDHLRGDRVVPSGFRALRRGAPYGRPTAFKDYRNRAATRACPYEPRKRRSAHPIRPSTRNVSRSQKLASVTKPVRNAMPVSTRRPPMAFSTSPRWARKRARKAAKGPTAAAAIRNGMPRPSE